MFWTFMFITFGFVSYLQSDLRLAVPRVIHGYVRYHELSDHSWVTWLAFACPYLDICSLWLWIIRFLLVFSSGVLFPVFFVPSTGGNIVLDPLMVFAASTDFSSIPFLSFPGGLSDGGPALFGWVWGGSGLVSVERIKRKTNERQNSFVREGRGFA